MIDKGKISGSESDDDGNDEFAEFMRWKQQKRKAQRRGIDDWDQDNWTEAPQRPVNRSSSGYSSASSGPNRQNAVQGRDVGFRGQKIEQGTFIINHSDVQKFDRTFELGAENTFKGDKAAIAGAFTGDHNVEFHDDGQAGGDVKGVRNRVAAGIMHFKYAFPSLYSIVIILTLVTRTNRKRFPRKTKTKLSYTLHHSALTGN